MSIGMFMAVLDIQIVASSLPEIQTALNIPQEALRRGLLINCTHDTVIRMLPPYILTEQDVDRAITVLNRVFKKVK